MLTWIDSLLNRITMYRLVLYILEALIGAALVLSLLGWLAFSPWLLIYSIIVILIVCWLTNVSFARVFRVPANVESIYITALILVLIISPPKSFFDTSYLLLAGWASIWAIASKFILAIRKKHLFNPAALAVALMALTVGLSASWWVGTRSMMVFVLIGGLLITRKIRRFDLVLTFLAAALISLMSSSLLRGVSPTTTLMRALFQSPLLFFAGVMLTEPMTTPPTRRLRIWYGALVGLLFSPAIHLGSLYSTPELALIVGNIFSYIVSPKDKLILYLREVKKVTADVYDFIFDSDRYLKFRPGQYLEWTLAHEGIDNRGMRRYFTIASAPTEEQLRIGVKFYPRSSSFKTELKSLEKTDMIVASQLAGDFVLPKNKQQKLVFLAGGIGITPFRSMIQYMLDTKEGRPIVLIYSNRTANDLAYKELLDEAVKQLGIKVVYAVTETDSLPANWIGEKGYITGAMIKEQIPDYAERLFYISGPHSFVSACDKALKDLGLHSKQIKKDYFPGLV